MGSGIHPDDFDRPGTGIPQQGSSGPSRQASTGSHGGGRQQSPRTSPAFRHTSTAALLIAAFCLLLLSVFSWFRFSRPTGPASNASVAVQPPAPTTPRPDTTSRVIPAINHTDSRIIGKWKQVNATEDVFEPEFLADGTMRQLNESGRFVGKYRFVDQNTLYIDGLSCPCGVKFQFDGGRDMMILSSPSGTALVLTRIDERRQPAPVPSLSRISARRVTSGSYRDSHPAWGTNGTIYFLSNRGAARGNQNNVWEVSSDGEHLAEIVHVRVSTPTEWGDPGLADHLEVGRPGEIFVLEAQRFHEVMRVAVSMSPGSTVFRQAVDGNDNAFTVLLSVPGGQGASGVFVSRSTNRVAWTATVPGRSVQIRAASLESLNGQSTLTHGERLLELAAPAEVHGMSFSPNRASELVASICWTPCSTGPDLYILNVQSRIVRRLTMTGEHGARNLSPVWSPDGSWIAYTSKRSNLERIWVVKADGTSSRQIETGNERSRDPPWSPDGTRLAFASGDESVSTIWLVDFLGR